MKWAPHLLKLNPAGMDAPPPHGEVGLPAPPCKNGKKLQGSGSQKKVTLSNLQKSFTKAMNQY